MMSREEESEGVSKGQIAFECPSCGEPTTADARCAGERIQCDACLEVVDVPGEPPPVQSAAEILLSLIEPDAPGAPGAPGAHDGARPPALALLPMAVAALVGALFWVGFTLATGYVAGVIGILIGVGVGLCGIGFGARGPAAAGAAAMLTAFAIAGGEGALLALLGMPAFDPLVFAAAVGGPLVAGAIVMRKTGTARPG